MILLPYITAQRKYSQFPLVEIECTISLPIVFISSYNSTTGVFTVPPGGDGFYHFSITLQNQAGERGHFQIQLNGHNKCTAHLPFTCPGTGSCNAHTSATAGDEVKVVYLIGTDDTPLNLLGIRNEFLGFRLDQSVAGKYIQY